MKDAHNGISRLARVLSKRTSEQTESPLVVDFGTVKKNGSLHTNTFPKDISKSDYIILKSCKSDIKEGESTRVLVAWVEDDPVVVGVLADQEGG